MKLLRRLLVLALIGAGFVVYRVAAPYQGFTGEVFVEIPRGTTADGIARLLAEAGVVRSRYDWQVIGADVRALAQGAASFTENGVQGNRKGGWRAAEHGPA